MKEAGFTWAFPAYFKSLMVENMTVLDSNKMAKVLLRRLILAMMWSIWMERDARIMKRRNSLLLCGPQTDKPFIRQGSLLVCRIFAVDNMVSIFTKGVGMQHSFFLWSKLTVQTSHFRSERVLQLMLQIRIQVMAVSVIFQTCPDSDI